MGWMAGIALLLGSQDPVEAQIESILRQYEMATPLEQAGARLAEQLMALGGPAIEPLARRLAEDLRDGTVPASAEGVIEALEARSEAQGPLQAAFADGATPPAGRIELARALAGLMDQSSWRDGLLAIAADPEVDPADRRRAAELLMEAGDARVLPLMAEIGDLGGAEIMADLRRAEELMRRWSEEPRTAVVAEGRPAAGERPRPAPRRKEAETDKVTMAYYVSLGAAAAGIVTLLLISRRKG